MGDAFTGRVMKGNVREVACGGSGPWLDQSPKLLRSENLPARVSQRSIGSRLGGERMSSREFKLRLIILGVSRCQSPFPLPHKASNS